MEGTPKLKRKSLTLNRKNKREDLPTTPQRRVPATSTLNGRCTTSSTLSLSSDGGIECTPPHKKQNLDDSIDYSPKCFDTSFSPSCLLSQSLVSDNAEVGWKWGRRTTDELCTETATTTPDSAYAADSSFASGGSTSTEASRGTARFHNDIKSQRNAYELQRQEQREKREIQLRRAAKMRTDELLKQRYAKLQEQLREADARRQKEKEKENHPLASFKFDKLNPPKIEAELEKTDSEVCIFVDTENLADFGNDTLNEFLNDSDSDGLLFEATQQVESKIVELTQMPGDEQFELTQLPQTEFIEETQMPNKFVQRTTTTTNKNYNTEAPSVSGSCAKATTPRQDKRSSLYMKFLEDDSPDDWFLSLDDVIMQATQQIQKPKSTFQRHNSMPTETVATLMTNSRISAQMTSSTATSTFNTALDGNKDEIATKSKYATTPKMKRHASSHAISPAGATLSTDQRARQIHMRK